MVDVGGVDGNQRPALFLHIGKAGAVEHQPVIDFGHPVVGAVAAIEQPTVIPGQQKTAPDVIVDVAAEKVLVEIAEDAVAVKPVIGGGKAAARHGRDDIHGVEQPRTRPIRGQGKIAQALEHAIAESRGTLAAAGNAQQHHQIGGRPFLGQGLEAIAALGDRPACVVKRGGGEGNIGDDRCATTNRKQEGQRHRTASQSRKLRFARHKVNKSARFVRTELGPRSNRERRNKSSDCPQ